MKKTIYFVLSLGMLLGLSISCFGINTVSAADRVYSVRKINCNAAHSWYQLSDECNVRGTNIIPFSIVRNNNKFVVSGAPKCSRCRTVDYELVSATLTRGREEQIFHKCKECKNVTKIRLIS